MNNYQKVKGIEIINLKVSEDLMNNLRGEKDSSYEKALYSNWQQVCRVISTAL